MQMEGTCVLCVTLILAHGSLTSIHACMRRMQMEGMVGVLGYAKMEDGNSFLEMRVDSHRKVSVMICIYVCTHILYACIRTYAHASSGYLDQQPYA